MSDQGPSLYQDLDDCVEAVIGRVGKSVVIGTPLGIGKPNQLLNAFFQRAKQDSTIDLTIITALSLERPTPSSDLERRFLEPFVERQFGDYPDLDYLSALRRGDSPANVKVLEFYIRAGAFLNVNSVQQNYISSNYTHVARDMADLGVNVVLQLVSKKETAEGLRYSLSSNPDVTLDLIPLLRQRPGADYTVVGQVNNFLPFMYQDAMVNPDYFDMIVDNSELDFKPFAPPNMPINNTDHMIGLYASTLIKDGGTLQIGIGSLAEAFVYATQLRHQQNEKYRGILDTLHITNHFRLVIDRVGETRSYDEGLYGASEMFMEGFLHLYESQILKRKVYDHIVIQQALNDGRITERVTATTLELLIASGAINAKLTATDFALLQHFGVLRSDLRFTGETIQLPNGHEIAVDLRSAGNRNAVIQHCLGDRLKSGILMHAAFFLGPPSFYDALTSMSDGAHQEFCMTSVGKVNQLYGDEELERLQRKKARFINSAMKVTLMGAVVSDGLENGQVITGVGGQYNFVAMAHALPDGRSIIMIRSTRGKGRKLESNAVWNYGHTTIPRHLRDIVITEYGIADLRGKPDKEVIMAMLNITDSRFQSSLLQQAKKAGKISRAYEIPAKFRDNFPESLDRAIALYKAEGLFQEFPFGTDFTTQEIILAKTLKGLKHRFSNKRVMLSDILHAVFRRRVSDAAYPYLERLKLDKPATFKEKLTQRLVANALERDGYIDQTLQKE